MLTVSIIPTITIERPPISIFLSTRTNLTLFGFHHILSIFFLLSLESSGGLAKLSTGMLAYSNRTCLATTTKSFSGATSGYAARPAAKASMNSWPPPPKTVAGFPHSAERRFALVSVLFIEHRKTPACHLYPAPGSRHAGD